MHACMDEKMNTIYNLTLNDGDKVGDGGEGARGGRPVAKPLGDRPQHLLLPVDVRL